jgi:hypothetical protein
LTRLWQPGNTWEDVPASGPGVRSVNLKWSLWSMDRDYWRKYTIPLTLAGE